MLTAADGAPAAADNAAATLEPAAGNYQCTGIAAGNMKVSFKGNGGYANEQGKSGEYKVDPASGLMAFTSGPWQGYYAKSLPHGRVGLSADASGKMFYMTCDKR